MSGKEFKQILDTICSGGTTEPNWGGIMEIVEMLKRKEIPPKKASSEVRKKLLESKESVVLNALFVIEAVVKNTPSSIHRDFLSQELLTSMKALVENQNSGMSRAIDKILEVLGEWKAVFGEDSTYKGVSNVFTELERGGYYIPEATIASASYIKKGPEFQESDNCYLCDKKFKFAVRRHHCRNCGKSICRSCEGEKAIDLPHFDFDAPQIVCITCYKKLEKPSESSDSPDGSRPGPSPQPPATQSNSDELHLQEEEDLQMAIAISLNEQENKKKKTSSSKPVSEPVAPPTFTPAPPTTVPSAPPSSLYGPIYADLDFSQATPTTSTVPAPKTSDKGITEFEQYSSRGQQQRTGNTSQTQLQQQQPGPPMNGVSPLCSTLNRLIDQFNQRMEDVSGKGLSIATDQAILSLHQDLTALHIQLLQQIDETQEKKSDQERFLHKLEESKEARITFDTMKRRHDEQLLQQEREQQALAQMQVQMKLALLRQQKAEQMAYGQSMQSERLNRLSSQRAEYEKTLAMQRENERLKLMTLEEQVYKQQFGGMGGSAVGMETAPYGAPPPSLYNAPPPAMAPPPPVEPYGGASASYAGPLPPKVDPPTYQPISGYQQLPVSAYSHPLPTQTLPPPTQPGPPPTQTLPPPTQSGPPPTHYQPTLYQPPDLGPPPPPNYSYSSPYGAPPSMAPSTLPAPPYVPSSSTEIPLFQPNEGLPPPEVQRVPSVPPLISFD